MTTQPETLEQARIAVREVLAPYRRLYSQFQESSPDLPSRADDKYKVDSEMARLLRGVSKHLSGSALVERAIPLAKSGDWEAWTVCSMALRHPEAYRLGEDAQRALMAFAADVMDGLAKPPKRVRPSTPIRNQYVVLAVRRALSWNLAEYNSGDAGGSTACSIVAEEMNLSPGAVQTIWQNRPRRGVK